MADEFDDIDPAHEDIRERYGWKEGEREAMDRELAERQREQDRLATLQWARERAEAREAEANARAEVVTKRVPSGRRDNQATASGEAQRSRMSTAPQRSSHGFSAAEVRLLQCVMEVLGEALVEQEKKAHDDVRRIENELRYALDRKVDDRKLDKIVSTLRSEMLTERLAHERELRAMEQRYYRGTGSSTGAGRGVHESVHEMIEIN